MTSYPLTDLQRAYYEVDQTRQRYVEAGGETKAVAALVLGEVLTLMLEIDPTANAGTPYTRFDGDLQFDDDLGASYGQE